MAESKHSAGSELKRRIEKVVEALTGILRTPTVQPARVPVPVPVPVRRPR